MLSPFHSQLLQAQSPTTRATTMSLPGLQWLWTKAREPIEVPVLSVVAAAVAGVAAGVVVVVVAAAAAAADVASILRFVRLVSTSHSFELVLADSETKYHEWQ